MRKSPIQSQALAELRKRIRETGQPYAEVSKVLRIAPGRISQIMTGVKDHTIKLDTALEYLRRMGVVADVTFNRV